MRDSQLDPPEPRWTQEDYELVFSRRMYEAKLAEEDSGEIVGDFDFMIDALCCMSDERVAQFTSAIQSGFNQPRFRSEGDARALGNLILELAREAVTEQLEDIVEAEAVEELEETHGRAEQ